MRILVLGATGVLGRNVLPRLLERGHKVRALVRQPEQVRLLNLMEIEAKMGDLFDRHSLEVASRGCHAVLHLAIVPPQHEDQDRSLNDRIQREGTYNLLKAIKKNDVRRYLQQSTTLLYGENGWQIVDESAALQVSSLTQAAADMEMMVRESNLEWSILRGGIFYGAGTGLEAGWRQSALEDRLELPGDGRDLISLIHVVDMARAVVAALERPKAGIIYNIVDDEPVRYEQLFNHVAAQLGANPPKAGGPRFLPSLGCSNIKAQLDLAWCPVYPNYQSGLADGQFVWPQHSLRAASHAAGKLQHDTFIF